MRLTIFEATNKGIVRLSRLSVEQALSRAQTFRRKGEIKEAKILLQSILQSFPGNKRAQKALSQIEKQNCDNELTRAPEHIIHHLITLYNEGRLSAVVSEAQNLVKKYPDTFVIWNLLGVAAAQIGELECAINAFKKALHINPNQAAIYSNIGNVLKDQGKVHEAIDMFSYALELKNDHPQSHNNLGNALKDLNKFEEALASYEHALSLKPDYAEAYHNMGTVFSALGKVEDAMKSYNKALSLRPNYPDAYDNLGRLHWSLQNFSTAFELMEWRWLSKRKFIGTEFKDDMPIWDGSASKKVFVWKEQGIGDEIMFSSVFSELNATSQEVIIECDTRLLPLFERSFPSDIKFVEGRNLLQECNYNCHIALASLPKHFRTELDDFSKSANGWLKPDYKKVGAFKRQIQSHKSETIIGVSWFTNASGPRSRQRSISLVNLAKHLGSIPATFVNLQYGAVAEELLSVKSQTNFNIISIDDLDLFHDIDGLAALVSACDIVVSVDNLTVHLAGALGVDTRVLLPSVADERWALDRKDSYWYNSLTLYRQQINGEWDQPLELLINDLKTH